jgi:hypothetical protein
VFRVTASVEVLIALGQPVLAGGFLSGHYALLAWHATNATATGLTAIAMTAAGVLLWRPGRGPLWPAVASAALFGLEALQIVLGYTRVLAVHIPLGVAIIGCLALLTVWAWRPATPPEPATDPEPVSPALAGPDPASPVLADLDPVSPVLADPEPVSPALAERGRS